MGNYDSAKLRRKVFAGTQAKGIGESFIARQRVAATRTVGGVKWPAPEPAIYVRDSDSDSVPMPHNSGMVANSTGNAVLDEDIGFANLGLVANAEAMVLDLQNNITMDVANAAYMVGRLATVSEGAFVQQ